MSRNFSNTRSITMAQVSSLLKAFSDLRRRLPHSNDTEAVETLLDDLRIHLGTVKGLAFCRAGEARACSRELEPEAIHLWNLCTRLRREMDADVGGDDDQIAGPLSADVKTSKRVLLVRCRALAFFVIDVARRHASFPPTGGGGGDGATCGCPSSGAADLLYLLRLALKAARSCVEAGEAELALACLQKGADYVREVKGGGCPEEFRGEAGGLETEYFIVRTWQVCCGALLVMGEIKRIKRDIF